MTGTIVIRRILAVRQAGLGISNAGFLLVSGECGKKRLMQAANKQIVERFYQGLVDRDERVLVLHTSDVPSALEQFERLARRSGQSIYKWSKESGLQSLKDGGISVPGSSKLPDMLRYVLSSKHYGVYIVTDFGFQFGRRCEDFLLQIRRTEFGDARKVILVGENPKIPPWVSGHLVHVVENEPGEFQLRLRNGRWVA